MEPSGKSIHTPPCVKQIAGGKPLSSRGSLAQCSVMTQRGEVGEVGREAQEGGIYVYLW